MILNYGTLMSPVPVTLSVGTIRKPTLLDISHLTFDTFNEYEIFLKMTPRFFYTNIIKDDEKKKEWINLSEDERDDMTIYDLIVINEKLRELYLDILSFFFIEKLVYVNGLIIVYNPKVEEVEKLKQEDIVGIITKETFMQVLEVIQQICYIYEYKEKKEDLKFKNKLAQKLYARMLKAKEEDDKRKEVNLNFTLPNIISSVCSNHGSLNYSNIWGLTVFQLMDSFDRIRDGKMYEISSVRLSVWGDEKNQFDAELWYKNNFDKKNKH